MFAVPTPFASHAFHPVDGYLQSVPYHLFIFLFPLHRILYLGLFVFVNFWSIFVRPFRREERTSVPDILCMPDPWFRYDHRPCAGKYHQRTSTSHATPSLLHSELWPGTLWSPFCLHHLIFCTLQYFTFADRVGGSYRHPESSLDPALDIKPFSSQPSEVVKKTQ